MRVSEIRVKQIRVNQGLGVQLVDVFISSGLGMVIVMIPPMI